MGVYGLDFGSSNGGLSPVFSYFRDAATGAALPAPAIFPATAPAWTYYFGLSFPILGSPTTQSVEYGVSAGGVDLSGVIAAPTAPPATRFVLDFGAANGGQAPPAFTWFRDAYTDEDLTPPAVVADADSWTYHFDYTSLTVKGVSYGITIAAGTPTEVTLTGMIDVASPVQLPAGADTLAYLRQRVRERSDTENDPHISDAELTDWINRGAFELYDMLVAAYGDDYFMASALVTTDGQHDQFPFPDDFYKLIGVDVSTAQGQPGTFVPLQRFNVGERAQYALAGQVPYLGYTSIRYRPRAKNLWLNCVPAAGLVMQILYVPRMTPLVNDTDAVDGISGWTDYVIVDAAIRAKAKSEEDTSDLRADKMLLKQRIEAMKQNRDAGTSKTTQRTRRNQFGFDGISPFNRGPFGWG